MSIYSPTSQRTSAHTLSHSFLSPSSTSDYFTQTTNTTVTPRDPQAQLLKRWKALGIRLSTECMSWKTVVDLNRKLDEAESVIGQAVLEKGTEDGKKHKFGLGIANTVDPRQPLEATGQATPPVSDAPERLSLSVGDNQMTSGNSALLERVTRVAEQLRQRQQEFKHLHDVAVVQTEKEVQEILTLKTERDQLQKDVVDDEAELTYLKLKLRIIEIQTLPYVPRKDQDDLAAGIERWKLDWADVDKRYRKRRWKRGTSACVDR